MVLIIELLQLRRLIYYGSFDWKRVEKNPALSN